MQFFQFFESPVTDIVCLFFAIIVSYYTVQSINGRYEFSDDAPRSFKTFKAFWAAISFVGTFAILILIAGAF